jgi:hypothetical protein
LDDAEEAFRVATRALIRVNLMDNLYAPETRRTNRIGVGITGVHEFAYKFFGIGFREMIDPENNPAAQDFWNTMARFSRAAQDEAAFYSSHLGLNAPHTITTCKPSGSVSKLCGVTEGWHLPAMAQYLRWVQFRNDDPLVETYKSLGYPARELKSYSGTTIIGFPTQPVIATLGMGDKLVTAQEATPEEQYKWVQLGEKYWLDGDLENAPSNQISYTLKYDTNIVGYEEFRDMLIQYQSQIRCCSVLPIEDTSAYEYLPEEMITKAHYEELVHAIKSVDVTEDIAFEHLDCATGACPVDFVSGDK